MKHGKYWKKNFLIKLMSSYKKRSHLTIPRPTLLLANKGVIKELQDFSVTNKYIYIIKKDQ